MWAHGGVSADLHGPQHTVKLVLPRKPRGGYAEDSLPWWEMPLAVAEEPVPLSSIVTGETLVTSAAANVYAEPCAAPTWVECMLCGKWRALPNSHSDMDFSGHWECSFNPDLAFNSCDVPEEDWSEDES